MSASPQPIPFLDLVADHAEVRDELDAAWSQAVDTGGLIGGQVVTDFEDQFAAYQQSDICIGVGNGTDALELILAAAGIGPGDEVIIPANTFIATAEAVVRCGADVTFADVDPETLLITGDTISAAVTPRTAAVMAVHLYGQMVDLDDVGAAVSRHQLALVEDAAQAHGASWNGVRAGSSGLAAGFSFYPGKNLGALGDGGAVVTNDPALAETIRSMSNHGRSSHSKYHHDLLGRNSRLDALQARALSIKLERLDDWNDARRSAAGWYRKHLPSTVRPLTIRDQSLAVHHLGVIEVPEGTRDEIGAALDAAKVGWGIHYPVPCHQQVPFQAGPDVSMPITEAAASRILSLPMHPHLTEDDVVRVAEVLDGHSALA